MTWADFWLNSMCSLFIFGSFILFCFLFFQLDFCFHQVINAHSWESQIVRLNTLWRTTEAWNHSRTHMCFPLSNGNHFQFTAFVLLLFIVISITLNMLLFGLSAFKIIYSFPSIADEDSGLFHFPSTQLTSSVISYYIWLDYYSILTLL